MTVTVEAIYENGVLKLAQPLTLAEGQKVRVTVQDQPSVADRIDGMFAWTGDPAVLDYIIHSPDLDVEESA
jgi:predicted DNA-binding antitoxin AbrB/MazE fold protein